MASTAWTATREELVRELSRTRTALNAATSKAQALERQIEEARLRKVESVRRARRKNHERNKRHAQIIAELKRQGNREALELQEAFRTTPPDPDAAEHRRALLAALKEKP